LFAAYYLTLREHFVSPATAGARPSHQGRPTPVRRHGGGRRATFSSITITLDHYGHLMPGSEAEAAGLLGPYLEREVV